MSLKSEPLLQVVANAQNAVRKLKCPPTTKFLVSYKDVIIPLIIIHLEICDMLQFYILNTL